MSYQLGVTEANMQDLADLNLPEPLFHPLSDFAWYSGSRQRGDGVVIGTGRPRFSWRFNELTVGEMGTLLYFVTTGGVVQASKTIYVRTRVPVTGSSDREFRSFRAVMLTPVEPGDARYDVNRRFRDVSVRFIQAVEV